MAGAFPGWTKEKLLERIKFVWGEFSENFPSFKVKKRWEVALLHKGYFKHYSLLFTVPGCREGLLIHLVVDEENRMSLDFHMVDLSEIEKKALKKKFLGVISKPVSAATIIRGAHNLLMSMGSYHAALNNCQDYCQLVAECLGVSVPFSGADAVAAGVAGGAIAFGGFTLLSLLVHGLRKLFSSGDDDEEDDEN